MRPVKILTILPLAGWLSALLPVASEAQVAPSAANVRKKPAPAPHSRPVKKPGSDRLTIRVRSVDRSPRPSQGEKKPRPPAVVTGRPQSLPARPQAGPGKVAVTTPPSSLKPPVAAPPVAAPPVAPSPPPDAKTLIAARRWQDREAGFLEQLGKVRLSLAPARHDLIAAPAEPPQPAEPRPVLAYRHLLTLRFVREDRVPLDARQVQVTAAGLRSAIGPAAIELEGTPGAAGVDVAVRPPEGWELVEAGDARQRFRSDQGRESRALQELRPAPRRVDEGPPPLFRSEGERETLGAQRVRTARPPGPAAAWPVPAFALGEAFSRLLEARVLMAGAIPVPPGASLEARRSAWQNLDRSVALLHEASLYLERSREDLARLRRKNAPKAVLGSAYRLDYEPLPVLMELGRARRAEYVAEAAWWQASCEQPDRPDRGPALQSLRDSGAAGIRGGELDRLAALMTEVAGKEVALRERIARGEFAPQPTPHYLVTRHDERTIALRRTVVDLRVAERDLRPGDVVSLATDPARLIPFQLRDGFWRAAVPRSILNPGQTLRIRRVTANSHLEAEAHIAGVDPYNLQGNDVAVGPTRIVGVRSLSVSTGSEERISVLEEIGPLDDPSSKLQHERRKARGARSAEDGSWTLESETAALRFRVRPSPYPAEEGRARGDTGRLSGRLVVEAIRLEGPRAGDVGGVAVGSPARQVEETFGVSVPASGLVRLLDDGLEIGMRGGQVEYMELRRPLAQLAGGAVPARPGTVVAVHHRGNRLRVATGPGFQPQPGDELEIRVNGRPLSDPSDNAYRVLVLDRAADSVIGKVVRQSRGGRVEDAPWDVVRAIPDAATRAVTLRMPGAGG